MSNFFVSENTLQELGDVLHRDFIKERFKFTDEIIQEFLDTVRNLAVVLQNVPQVFSLLRDVDDEEYINLAVAAKADYIVSRDNDLLDLMIGFNEESKTFRQKFRPLRIVQPLEFLKIIEAKIKEDLTINP